MNLRRHIPNAITCCNILAGSMACVAAMHGDEPMWGMLAYQWAWLLIGIAAVADFCDGLSARLLHAYSDMGKELDSLCDCVSFGLAPALLVYSTMAMGNGGDWTCWLAMAIPVAGALRLAKFNIDTRQTTSFIGLPIPANAIFWIGATAWVHTHGYPTNGVMIGLIALFSYLMVSPLKMFSLKMKNFAWRENFRRYVLAGAAVLFVATEHVAGLAWTILLYILISAFGRKVEA